MGVKPQLPIPPSLPNLPQAQEAQGAASLGPTGSRCSFVGVAPGTQHCLSAPRREVLQRPRGRTAQAVRPAQTNCCATQGSCWDTSPSAPHPEAGLGFSLRTPTAQCTRTPCGPRAFAHPCSGAAPSQPPGTEPGEGRGPAYPPLCAQALRCLAHSGHSISSG